VTFGELGDFVRSITFCGGLAAWGVRFENVRRVNWGIVELRIRLRNLPDRDTGRLSSGIAIDLAFLESDLASWSKATALREIRGSLLDALTHETDESILYKGVRVLDPHRKVDAAVEIAAADEQERRERAQVLSVARSFLWPLSLAGLVKP
jgi:hypothetical protein